jgi:hypothetical protein
MNLYDNIMQKEVDLIKSLQNKQHAFQYYV